MIKSSLASSFWRTANPIQKPQCPNCRIHSFSTFKNTKSSDGMQPSYATIGQNLVFLRGFSGNSFASLSNRARARRRARARMASQACCAFVEAVLFRMEVHEQFGASLRCKPTFLCRLEFDPKRQILWPPKQPVGKHRVFRGRSEAAKPRENRLPSDRTCTSYPSSKCWGYSSAGRASRSQ